MASIILYSFFFPPPSFSLFFFLTFSLSHVGTVHPSFPLARKKNQHQLDEIEFSLTFLFFLPLYVCARACVCVFTDERESTKHSRNLCSFRAWINVCGEIIASSYFSVSRVWLKVEYRFQSLLQRNDQSAYISFKLLTTVHGCKSTLFNSKVNSRADNKARAESKVQLCVDRGQITLQRFADRYFPLNSTLG